LKVFRFLKITGILSVCWKPLRQVNRTIKLRLLVQPTAPVSTAIRLTMRGHMNNWGIPNWLEKEVKERDKFCVYCGIQMIEKMPPRGPRKAVATWEHIINDESIVTRENIARCCVACNSSKGTKKLSDWIQSSYCKKLGINKDTVAEVVKKALRKF
jgi:hypothetical protein